MLVDLARLTVCFDSLAGLVHCIEGLLEANEDGRLRVLWLDNKFRAPSALGYRDVNVGIGLQVPRGIPTILFWQMRCIHQRA